MILISNIQLINSEKYNYNIDVSCNIFNEQMDAKLQRQKLFIYKTKIDYYLKNLNMDIIVSHL